jgi:hypothetical protein
MSSRTCPSALGKAPYAGEIRTLGVADVVVDGAGRAMVARKVKWASTLPSGSGVRWRFSVNASAAAAAEELEAEAAAVASEVRGRRRWRRRRRGRGRSGRTLVGDMAVKVTPAWCVYGVVCRAAMKTIFISASTKSARLSELQEREEMYRAADLVEDCANPLPRRRREGTPAASSAQPATLQELLDRETYSCVWAGIENYVREELAIGKGVHLPRFGRFTFIKGHTRPILLLSDEFTQPYSIRFKQPPVGHTVPDVDLNFSKVAFTCKLTKDVVKGAYRDFVCRLGEALNDGDKTVEVEFEGVGTVEGDRFNLAFRHSGEEKVKQATTAAFSKRAVEGSQDLKVQVGGGREGGRRRLRWRPRLQ